MLNYRAGSLLKALISWVMLCLVGCIIAVIVPMSAHAHRPHDVVPQVIVSPSYAEDNTVYALARNNLLRSQDRGETWLRLNHGLDNTNVLNTLAIAPGELSMLYASTAGDGIYRSENGGDTWETANAGLDSLDIRWVEVSPVNAQLAFAQTQDGRLYRTEDGGDQWSMVLADIPATTLMTVADGSSHLLGDEQGQVWQSNDGGATWQAIAELTDVGAIQTLAMAADAAGSQTLYIGTELDGVYRSTDGAQGFAPMNGGLSDLRIQDLQVAPDNTLLVSTWEAGAWYWDAGQNQWQMIGQGLTRDKQAYGMQVPHFYRLAVSPAYATDHELFLGGFDGLFRSQDKGQAWTQLDTISSGAIIAMAVSPTFAEDQTLAIATYVGELYISNDAGNSWQAIHQDLHLPRFTLDFQPLNGDQDPRRFFDIGLSSNYAADETLFSAILYTKVLRSGDGGEAWSIEQLSRGVRGVSLAVSPNFEADGTVFSTNQKGLVYRSQDRGETFQLVGELDGQPGNDSPSTVISPNFAEDQTLFNTGTQGVYKSTDAGATWELLTAGTELADISSAQIAIAPNFASDPSLFVGTKAGLFRTQDGGATWERIQSNAYGLSPFVEAVALSPNYENDQTVVVSVRGRGLFKSQDGGNTFATLGDPGLAISRIGYVPSAGRALQFSPNYAEDNTLFGFGTVDTSIYRSIDGGETWEVLPVTRLDINAIPPLGTLGNVGLFWEFNQSRLTKLALLLVVIGVASAGLWGLSNRGLITFPTQVVQSPSQVVTYGVPTWLKVTVIALVMVRLVFSLSYLSAKPFNADEVRGFYRLSGYQREEVMSQVFQGQILTTQDLQSYQTPSADRTLGDTLNALAVSPEHPPGYYVISWFWVKLWGDPLTARVLAVLLGIIYLPCAYWFCLELFQSAWVGLIATALLSLSPYHLLLAQGARQYSLWTILLFVSSALLLRALRLGERRSWVAYGVTVAAGFYAHLFFAFMLIAHGFYVATFEWRRWRSRLLPFALSAAGGVLLFSPWLWIVFTRLDTIDQNTQWVRNRSSDLFSIARSNLDKMAHLFVNLEGTGGFERMAYIGLWAIMALAFYCLIRWHPSRVWGFLLLPMVTTFTLLVIPDLLSGGGRSLQSRYLVPALLPVTLAVAVFLANAMKRSKYGWERLAWTGVFAGLLAFGCASSITVVRAPDLDYLEQGRTASVVNRELAPFINASQKPLVLSAATHSFALALSHEVHDDVSFQLVQDLEPEDWATIVDLSQAQRVYDDVFIYFPNQEFLTFLEETYGATLEPVFEESLYRAAT